MTDLKWCVALVDTTTSLPDGTHPVVFLGPATDARPGDTILVPETEVR